MCLQGQGGVILVYSRDLSDCNKKNVGHTRSKHFADGAKTGGEGKREGESPPYMADLGHMYICMVARPMAHLLQDSIGG